MSVYVTRSRPCMASIPHGREQSANISTAAFQVGATWDAKKYPQLGIAFLDGTAQQKQWVQDVVTKGLQPLIKTIRFVWNVAPRNSQIRISFAQRGAAYSAIGNTALDIPKNQPTMNLGWLDDMTDFDAEPYRGTGQVVLHEFGHAMGMIHEHQNPVNNPIVWNKPVVYQDCARTNHWSKRQVDDNIFQTYGSVDLCKKATTPEAKRRYCSGTMTNGSSYDPHSIMHYWFKPSWILSGSAAIPVNIEYSPIDKEWLTKYYSVSHETFTVPLGTDMKGTDLLFYALGIIGVLTQLFLFRRQ